MESLSTYMIDERLIAQLFFSARILSSDSPMQAMNNLEWFFDNWVEGSRIEHKYESLRDMIIRVQFLSVCYREVSVYVREQTPRHLQDVIKLTNQFIAVVAYPHAAALTLNYKRSISL